MLQGPPALKLTREIYVDRPPSEVFAFITDPSSMCRINPANESVEIVTGPPVRKGSSLRLVSRIAGRRMVTNFGVAEFQPDTCYSLVTPLAPILRSPVVITYDLAPQNGGTAVSLRMVIGLRWFSRLLAGPLRSAQSAQLDADLRNLKRLLEERHNS